MSYVDVLAVEVVNNPAKFCDPLSFKITFRCNAKTQEGESFGYFFTSKFESCAQMRTLVNPH